jgi:hypothetical protein
MNFDSTNRKRRPAKFDVFRGAALRKLRTLVTERSVGVGHLPQKCPMIRPAGCRFPVSRHALLISKTLYRVP